MPIPSAQPGEDPRHHRAQPARPASWGALRCGVAAQARHPIPTVGGDPAIHLSLLDAKERGGLCRTPAVDQYPLNDLPPLHRSDIASVSLNSPHASPPSRSPLTPGA